MAFIVGIVCGLANEVQGSGVLISRDLHQGCEMI